MLKDKKKFVGWSLSVLIFLFMVVASARGKFFEWEGKDEMFSAMGFSNDLMFKIGFVEVFVAAFFLLPGRHGFIGNILLTAYLGGAVLTHVRVGQAFFFPIIISVLAWVAYTLRDTEFREYLAKKN